MKMSPFHYYSTDRLSPNNGVKDWGLRTGLWIILESNPKARPCRYTWYWGTWLTLSGVSDSSYLAAICKKISDSEETCSFAIISICQQIFFFFFKIYSKPSIFLVYTTAFHIDLQKYASRELSFHSLISFLCSWVSRRILLHGLEHCEGTISSTCLRAQD